MKTQTKNTPKIPLLYLRDAIEVQLEVARREGADKVYFDALAIHPEASDDCTFGDLIDMRCGIPPQPDIEGEVQSWSNLEEGDGTL